MQFDASSGMLSLPIWITAALAGAIVVLGVLALARSGTIKTLACLLGLGVALFGAYAGWTILDRMAANDRVDERRVFEQRANELIARAMIPGSPLSCLDSNVGDQVAASCERLLFASPDTVSAAVSYITNRIALIGDGNLFASRSDLSYDTSLMALRRGLEADRFGIVAYVMSQQDNCNAQQCDALVIFRDPNRIRVNLQDKPFEALVARYAAAWPNAGAPAPVAEAPARGAAVAAAAPAGNGGPVGTKYDFPSATSIPAVSIMAPEPPTASASDTPPAAAPAAPKPAAQAAATPPKPKPKPAKRAPKPSPEAEAPVQLAPAAPDQVTPQRQSAQ